MISKGFFLTKYGTSNDVFELQDFDLPEIEQDEVLIEVEGFGLNYAEVMARQKLYREAPPIPCVLGYEVVGKVILQGKQTSTDFIGKRVVAFCKFGGYAKHVITKANAISEIDEMELTIALSLATQYVTAYYMSEYLATIRKNDRVLIHAAAGGVGTALIQLCKNKGAIVYAKSSSNKKTKYTGNLAADFNINYKISDYEEQLNTLLKENRLDAVFNPVGGSTFKKDMRLLGFGGKIYLYGGSELVNGKFGLFSSINFIRKMGFILPVLPMMQSKSILGINMLKIANNKPEVLEHCLQKVVKMCQEGAINPPKGQLFSENKFIEAHNLLQSGQSIGKIAIKWEQDEN